MTSITTREKILKERNKNVDSIKKFYIIRSSVCYLILDITQNIFKIKIENCIGCNCYHKLRSYPKIDICSIPHATYD